MDIAKNFQRRTPADVSASTTSRKNSSGFLPLFVSNAILTALSITNLALLSSMVAWLLDQKRNVHSFQIEWSGSGVPLNVEPKTLWVEQGHTSNGVAGYGFFLGVFGMIVAWRVRRSSRVFTTTSSCQRCTPLTLRSLLRVFRHLRFSSFLLFSLHWQH